MFAKSFDDDINSLLEKNASYAETKDLALHILADLGADVSDESLVKLGRRLCKAAKTQWASVLAESN